jgi:hypothetical protein
MSMACFREGHERTKAGANGEGDLWLVCLGPKKIVAKINLRFKCCSAGLGRSSASFTPHYRGERTSCVLPFLPCITLLYYYRENIVSLGDLLATFFMQSFAKLNFTGAVRQELKR